MLAHFSNVLIYPHAPAFASLLRFLFTMKIFHVLIVCTTLLNYFLLDVSFFDMQIAHFYVTISHKYHAACCSVFTFLVPTTNGCIDIKNLLVLFYSSRFPFFQDHVYNFMCIRWRRYSSETFWFEIRCSILYLFIFKWLSFHVPIEIAFIFIEDIGYKCNK